MKHSKFSHKIWLIFCGSKDFCSIWTMCACLVVRFTVLYVSTVYIYWRVVGLDDTCMCLCVYVQDWLFVRVYGYLHTSHTHEEFDVRTTTFTRVMRKIVLLENVWWFRSFIHLIILLVTTFPTHFARVFHQMIRFNHFN